MKNTKILQGLTFAFLLFTFNFSFAIQCPYEFGTGVYKARMLLAFIDTAEYYNDCEFPLQDGNNARMIAKPDSLKNGDNLILLTVYPNPSKDEVNFETISDKEINGVLEIFDFIGNRLFNISLNDNLNKHTISFKNYSSGLYFYKLTVNSEVIKNDKLIIIK